jgi:hypothetical protein
MGTTQIMSKATQEPVEKGSEKKIGKPSKLPVIMQAVKDGSLYKWASTGYTDEQLAQKLGVSRTTFYDYKAKYSDFSDTLIRARISTPVENAWNGLIKLTTGYHEKVTRKHKKIITLPNGDKKTEEEVYEDDVYVQPQASACAKILANYYHQAKKGGGFPEQYINEPIPETPENRAKKFDEMEEAMKDLIFGRK